MTPAACGGTGSSVKRSENSFHRSRKPNNNIYATLSVLGTYHSPCMSFYLYYCPLSVIGTPGQPVTDVCGLSSCSLPVASTHQVPLSQPASSTTGTIRSEGGQRRRDATTILKILCQCTLLQPHLYDLLVAKNSDGCTPFMQAVCCRAYNAALSIMDAATTLATTNPTDGCEPLVDKDKLMSMLYPRGSTLDNSPLHVLCCNDTCSFTWTGAEHINQVWIIIMCY